MTKNFFFGGVLILGLLLLANHSSAKEVFVNVGDGGGGNCINFDAPYIGFVDCETTLTGGYSTLAVTQPPRLDDSSVQWTANFDGSFNYTVTSESSEFAGVPGTCGTGNNFDYQFQFNGDSFYMFPIHPGTCYYYCKIHGPSQMRGVVIVPATGSTTTTSTTTTTIFGQTTTTTTTLPNQPPSAVSLTPVNISTEPGVAQSFMAVYSDPNGYLNMTDVSLFLSGSTHNEWAHYSPQTNRFTMMGLGGWCSPGQATTLSNAHLVLNCSTSSVSGSGTGLNVTYNFTPQPPISGAPYRLIMAAMDQGGSNVNKDMGYWVINRRPTACTSVPMNSATPVGTPQTFVCQSSDPDGYKNIAEVNFYLSSGGMHNEWVHYLQAANIFFMMGGNDVCYPGQYKTLTNGYLSFDCANSIVAGSGNTLAISFQVTPLGPSSGMNYNIFTGVSDQAGAAHGTFGGTWQIQ